MTLTSFSQTVIKQDSNIVLPIPVAKEVIKDLIKGDAAQIELGLTKDILKNTEDKVVTLNKIIIEYKSKDAKYDSILVDYSNQSKVYNDLVKNLNSDLKTVKKALFVSKLMSTLISGGLIYLLLK